MSPYLNDTTAITDSVLNVIAHMPTTSLPALMDDDLCKRLGDAHYLRLAVLLAQKSCDEGGCPIGAIVDGNIPGVSHV